MPVRPMSTAGAAFWCAPIAIATAANGASVHDEFTGGSIDGSKWSTVLPHAGSGLTISSDRLRFQGRGYLNSVDDWDPVTEDVSVSGRWEFGNVDDFLQISTRSEGVPQVWPHENRNGLELWVRPSAGEFRIHQFVNGAETNLLTVPISIQAGDIFDFEIIDDGTSFGVVLTEVGGEGVIESGLVNTSLDTGFQKVTVHNRETSGMFGFLHEITIENVPSPGSVALLAMAGVFGVRRRR